MTSKGRGFCRGVVVALAVAGMSGCVGTGQSNFSCKGPSGGVACIDSVNVYEITNDPALREALLEELTEAAKRGDKVDPYEVLARLKGTRVAEHPPTRKTRVAALSQPKPILKPARVVRIWIAPWVDNKGDLHLPGYVFSEITPRRWELGEPETGTYNVLAPVQLQVSSTTGESETP